MICRMLQTTKALFDDFNTDKNIHLLRTSGAGQAKRLGEFQPTLMLVLVQVLGESHARQGECQRHPSVLTKGQV